MLESMVSLERRVHHASEAMVPLERGVIRTLDRRSVQVAWPGVCMAERSNPGKRRPAGVGCACRNHWLSGDAEAA